ncbi:MAG: hypothetical protein GY832_40175, partial [Chloroflexi bacterium]|nr:hypothetical protein [Chloroflexota bacterium]
MTAQTGLPQLQQGLQEFIAIADIILPNSRNREAVKNLTKVLSSEVLLDSFVPPTKDEVQLMTLHKAKGLEFD